MEKQTQQRVGLLQGTLDMLISRTLLYGPAHGHQIGKHIQRTAKGRKQLGVEELQWKQMAEAVARVMWPAAEEG
jgi:PadR family transcriptional regulator PadR